MDRISKEFSFSAAHRLTGLPPYHPCSRLHGHNYTVRVVLGGPLTEVGFVRDYGDLDEFKNYIDDTVDHRYLGYGDLYNQDSVSPRTLATGVINSVFDFNPTAELLAESFYQWLRDSGFPEVDAVGVSETPKTWAWYQQGEGLRVRIDPDPPLRLSSGGLADLDERYGDDS